MGASYRKTVRSKVPRVDVAGVAVCVDVIVVVAVTLVMSGDGD